MDQALLNKIMKRGVSDIIVEDEFRQRMEEGKPLRLKMGFDPSAPDIHVGHAVGLRKLRQLQDLGHKVVIIVGDWTAQIGDPSGKPQTRPMLTHAEVLENAETYLAQFFKIVDRSRAEVRWQSDWFGPFSLADVLKLTSRFTVAQFLQRDDFAARFAANQPIAITELLYPLLQAYDSVEIESDVEFGGTDQMFNLLVGRDLQSQVGQRPQQCFLVPLLPGTDGELKMSKSLGNYIGIDEPANDIFGKTMSLPDTMIVPYFENLTDIPEAELEEVRNVVANQSGNPMDLKKQLAHELVTQFKGADAAPEAQAHFEQTVQKGQLPSEIKDVDLDPGDRLTSGFLFDEFVNRVGAMVEEGVFVEDQDDTGVNAGDVVVDLAKIVLGAGLAASMGEARRLVSQGSVSVDGTQIRPPESGSRVAINVRDGSVIQRGSRDFRRLRIR
ncbi:MAG: tyrosine--tRNA ligase [SAR202 cluster bacterium]|jgi:tyrosyl-tRNA synthetase|nr:tyrosine--tRNA ligase [SAR202 cluster bacterium]MDP6300799.1 tyrosine--tRNA ligase [SAR202 cluster bacterium]MDP7102167.1 tyrosine--tRNA ligase [SAR202 cluster bacterium]MDP7224042.1 tyrosine--tRNA ligase [SAR202 cluster bacterium]MDP7412389.1 tyrosine--tRNA ligase [SAR202 cluster bacterium]|tara:strand:- start:7339 stop:8661 length:1323 start_codon:yes stop_codon:yes gene_type:complete